MLGRLVVVGRMRGVGGDEEMRARRRRVGTWADRRGQPGLRRHARRHVGAVERRRDLVAQSSGQIDASSKTHTDHGLVAVHAGRPVAYDREIDPDDREEDDDEHASKQAHPAILHRVPGLTDPGRGTGPGGFSPSKPPCGLDRPGGLPRS